MRVTKCQAAEALPDTVSVPTAGTGSLAPSVLLPAAGRKRQEKAPHALPAAAFCGAETGPPSPKRTQPEPPCTAAGLHWVVLGCPIRCFLQMPKPATRAERCTSPTKPVEGRGGEASVPQMRSRNGTGEHSGGATKVEGRVLTCSGHLLSIGKGQRGTKTGKEFLKLVHMNA